MNEDYNKEKRKEEYFKLLKESILARIGILPGISSLAATLLVVATFNPELIKLTPFVKFLLSILLILIPTPIFFYLYDTNEAANKSQKALEDELNTKFAPVSKKVILRISAYFPWIGLSIISFVIISIIFLIWCH